MKTCPKCNVDDSLEITIDLAADHSVQFFQCRNCESKWWERDGNPVPLEEVLDLTSDSESKKR